MYFVSELNFLNFVENNDNSLMTHWMVAFSRHLAKQKACLIFALLYQIYTHANVDAVDQGNTHVRVKWITIF